MIERWLEAGYAPPPEGSATAIEEWAAEGYPPIDYSLPPEPAEPVAPDPRLAVSRKEAAALLGISHGHFMTHVWPNIRVAKIGKREVIPVSELRTFLESITAFGLDSDG